LRKKVRDMASTILDFSNSSAEDCNATHQLAEELCVMGNPNAQLGKFHFKQMANHNEMSETILARAPMSKRSERQSAGLPELRGMGMSTTTFPSRLKTLS
jgi:hypothetical protein